jgi:hypothetical protein
MLCLFGISELSCIHVEAAMMKEYPLKPKSKLLLYGERQNVGEKIIIYAQPIYAIDEFASLYHLEDLADFSETMSQTGESISVSQILGQTLPVLTKTKEEVDEMDLIREIEMSQKEKSDTVSKQPTSIRKRIHSKPIKTIFKPHTKKPIPKLSTVKALTESPSPSLSVEDKKKVGKDSLVDKQITYSNGFNYN